MMFKRSRSIGVLALVVLAMTSESVSGQGPGGGFLSVGEDLHRVELETLETELVGNPGLGGGSVLAFDPAGTFYAVSRRSVIPSGSTFELSVLDGATGEASLVAELGPALSTGSLDGLAAAGGGTLWLSNQRNGLNTNLFRIDAATGEAVLIGEVDGVLRGLAERNGVLYGLQLDSAGSAVLVTLDKGTAAVTSSRVLSVLAPSGAIPLNLSFTSGSFLSFDPSGRLWIAYGFTLPGPIGWVSVFRRVDNVDDLAPIAEVPTDIAAPFFGDPPSGMAILPDTSTSIFLNDQRFRTSVEWADFDGGTGAGQAVPFRSDDSGLFWFFDPDNWEVLIKVIDACDEFDRFWVFAAATTNVEYTITVEDLTTGDARSYENPLGMRSPAITDTDAFATCP